MLYTGFLAASHYTNQGGSATYMCMHPEPQSTGTSFGANSDVYGTEYQVSNSYTGTSSYDHGETCRLPG